MILLPPGNRPAEIDLVPAVEKVLNQGQIGICTEYDFTTELSIIYYRATGVWIEFSKFYGYYWERQKEGRIGQDGAAPGDSYYIGQTRGVCLYDTWPDDPAKVDEQPPAICDVEAAKYKLKRVIQMPGNLTYPQKLDWIRNNLWMGRPVGMIFAIHEDFYRTACAMTDWRKMTWNFQTSPNNPVVGSHAVPICMSSDGSQHLGFPNSWGDDVGDGGFFGFPYNFLDYQNGPCQYFYTIISCGVPTMPVVPKRTLWQLNVPAITDLFAQYQTDMQPFIDECADCGIGLSDLDTAFNLAPGTAATFKANSPQYDWTNMPL